MKDRTSKGLNVVEVDFQGNTSGWEAYDYKVIIKRDEVKETYGDSGIVIAEATRDTEEWTVTKGVIVSLGHQAFTDGRGKDGELVYWDNRPEVGQRVMIKEYAGQKFIGEDGEKYLIVNDKEVACGRQK